MISRSSDRRISVDPIDVRTDRDARRDDRGKDRGSMAKDDQTTTPRKRVGDYSPDMETGAVLDGIANTEVEIAGVTFDIRKGKPRPGDSGPREYILSIIRLDDGRLFHTGGDVVVEKLAKVFGLTIETLRAALMRGEQPTAEADTFPLLATFRKEKSSNDPTRSYWTVE